jgi:hypothetical protein
MGAADASFYEAAHLRHWTFVQFARMDRKRANLVSVPPLMLAVFAGLAVVAGLTALLVGIVIRRVGEYAISRPCGEILFTIVDR